MLSLPENEPSFDTVSILIAVPEAVYVRGLDIRWPDVVGKEIPVPVVRLSFVQARPMSTRRMII